MFDQNAAHGTVSISFVYIRPKGTNSALSTRIPYPSSFESLMRTAHRLFDGMMNVASLFTEDGHRVRSLDDLTPGASILVSNCEEDMASPRRNPPSPIMRTKRQIMSTDSFALLFGTDGPQANVQDMSESEPKTFSFADKTTPANEPRPKPKFVSRRQKAKAEEQKRAEERQQQREEPEENQADSDQKRIRLVIRPKPRASDVDESGSEVEQKKGPTITIKKVNRADQSEPSAAPEDVASTSEASSKGIRLVRKYTDDRRGESASQRSKSREPEYSTELFSELDYDAELTESEDRTSSQMFTQSGEDESSRHHHRKGPHCRLQSKPRIQRMIEEDERREEEANEQRRAEEARLSEQQSLEKEDTEGSHKRRRGHHHHKSRKVEGATESEMSAEITTQDWNEEEEIREEPKRKQRRHKHKKRGQAISESMTSNVMADDAGNEESGQVTSESAHRKRKSSHHHHSSQKRDSGSGSELASNLEHHDLEASISANLELDASEPAKRDGESASDYLTESEDETRSRKYISSVKSKSTNRDAESVSSRSSMKRSEQQAARTPTVGKGYGQPKKTTPTFGGRNQQARSNTSTPVRTEDETTPSRRRTPVKREVHPEKLRELFRSVIGETSMEEKVGTALENIPVYQESLEVIPTVEEQQRTAWYAKLLEFAATQGLEPLGEDIYGIDDMIGRARCLLMNGRFNAGDGFGHRQNIGIIGPRKSGKSTFLRLLADEALVDLAATGEWKKTFVFILDWTKISPIAQDFAEFYHGMVAVTCQHLQWQRPHLAKHLSMIQKYFNSVTSLKNSPKFTKAFMVDDDTRVLSINLQKISDRMSSLWNDPTALVQWITSVIRFPIEIAKAFGFSKTLMIMDHVDTADVILSGLTDPFIESKEVVCLLDVIKFTIKSVNFIMACQDQSHFYAVLPSSTEDNTTNLNDHIELVSMIGLVPEPDDNRQFVINLVGVVAPIPFTVDTCGGVPSYLQIWEELNAMYDELEASEDDKEEKQVMLNVHVQEIMKLFFIPEDDEKRYEVEHVRRTTKNAKYK